MKFNKILSFSALAVFSLGVLVGCEDDSATQNQTDNDFVSFADMPRPVDVPQGETVTVEGKVYAGRTSNVDRVINLQVITSSVYNTAHPDEDGNPGTIVPVTTAASDEFSVPTSVTIPAGAKEATFQISVTDVDLGYTGKDIVIGIVPQAGQDISMSTIGTVTAEDFEVLNERLVLTARRRCDFTTFSIEISTDLYGMETTWELYDGAFNVIETGGPYPNGVAGGGETRVLCLEDGTYTFVVYDDYGDGMFDGTNQGYYRLVKFDADGNETEIAKNGTFGTDEVVTFTTP